EAQKALARGLKEELENQFPEIKGLNAKESQFYNLQGALERAVNRAGNKAVMKTGPLLTGGGGYALGHAALGAAGGAGVGSVAMILKAVMDDPMMQSKLAIAISRNGRITPAAANAKIAAYSALLANTAQKGSGAVPAGQSSEK